MERAAAKRLRRSRVGTGQWLWGRTEMILSGFFGALAWLEILDAFNEIDSMNELYPNTYTMGIEQNINGR